MADDWLNITLGDFVPRSNEVTTSPNLNAGMEMFL